MSQMGVESVRLTRDQYLGVYASVVHHFSKEDKKPTWQHLPAAQLYYQKYEATGAPEPVFAAKEFLSQTVWGRT